MRRLDVAHGKSVGESANAPSELALADLDRPRDFPGAVEATPVGKRNSPEGGRCCGIQYAVPPEIGREIGERCRDGGSLFGGPFVRPRLRFHVITSVFSVSTEARHARQTAGGKYSGLYRPKYL
jgi:hypothetical protein